MTKQLEQFKFFNESIVKLEQTLDESKGSGLIEATFTTWGPREGADGRRFFYRAEPFMEFIKGLEASGKPLPMYFQHDDESLPVGEWTAFEFTENGMSGTGRMFTNTTAGRDLYTIMKESPNLVGGVSVGAYAEEWALVDEAGEILPDSDPDRWEKGYFSIMKGGLSEVSIVMQPNNPQANINKLESCVKDDGSVDPRDLEQALRDAGVSKQNAEAAVSVFKKVNELRDAIIKPNENEPARSDTDAVASDEALLAALERRELLQNLDNRLKD